MQEGSVKWFNETKGFGFISDGKTEYFCHYKAIRGTGYKTLNEGEKVQFKPGISPKGAIATDVVRINQY